MNRDRVANSGERKAAIIRQASPVGGVGGAVLMLLRLGARWFAVDVLAIAEVATKGAVTRVPTAPKHILGITSLGGRLVTVVSLEQVIGGADLLSHENAATLPRLVVLRHGECEMAVVAEGIHGMAAHVRADQTDQESTAALPKFVREEFRWDGHRVALLDVPRLVAGVARLSGIDSSSDWVEA
jgi:chemotaxis signal transduction protein